MSDLKEEIRTKQRLTQAGKAKKMLPGLIIIVAIMVAWLIFRG